MANDLTGNPLYVDTAATIISDPTTIQLMQWVDDNADIADNDDLQITMDTTQFNLKPQRGGTPDAGVVLWECPLHGHSVNRLVVDAIDHGVLLIWTK